MPDLITVTGAITQGTGTITFTPVEVPDPEGHVTLTEMDGSRVVALVKTRCLEL